MGESDRLAIEKNHLPGQATSPWRWVAQQQGLPALGIWAVLMLSPDVYVHVCVHAFMCIWAASNISRQLQIWTITPARAGNSPHSPPRLLSGVHQSSAPCREPYWPHCLHSCWQGWLCPGCSGGPARTWVAWPDRLCCCHPEWGRLEPAATGGWAEAFSVPHKTTKTAMVYVHKTEKLLDGVFWEILMHIFFPF